MANLFQDILNTALIGTERRPYRPGQGEGAAGEIIGALDASDGERALLAAAAVSAQYQRAGALPGMASKSLPEPAPDETLPRCNPASAQHLMSILRGTQADPINSELLPEWLEAAARAGKHAPEECLPTLLGVGVKNTALRETIIAVIGERGRWLGGLNKQWSFAASSGDEDDWQTATGAARLALLKRTRAGDPAAARALVESTWVAEKADDRVEFINCFSAGLSLADEPFLESCLDDRSKKVCEAAAHMLAQLPGSQLGRRMLERLEGMVSLSGGRKPQFNVVLPDELDAATQRDGIVDVLLTIDGTNFGEKAAWVVEMLRLVPPSHWVEKWGRGPSDLLALAEKSDEWAQLLMHGWHRAAKLFGDMDWLIALMKPGYTGSRWSIFNLSPTEKEKVVLEVIDRPIFKADLERFQLLERCNHLWSKPLAQKAIQLIEAQRDVKPDKRDWSVSHMFKVAGCRMPTELTETVRKKLKPDDEKWKQWQTKIREVIDILEFRRDMLEELSRDR